MSLYIEEIFKQAKKAAKIKEVPIGAIIVCKNKIIAKAYNQRIRKKDVLGHAEIIAIKKAAKKMKDWRLNKCDLYVTLEPCHMCKEIIKEARINNVYYLVSRQEGKKEYDKTNISSIKEKRYEKEQIEYKQLLSDFFKLNCNR